MANLSPEISDERGTRNALCSLRVAGCFLLAAGGGFCIPHQGVAAAPSASAEFQKGITFTPSWACPYNTEWTRESLPALLATGANAVALLAIGEQSSPAETSFRFGGAEYDARLRETIEYARRSGLRVMLKLAVYIPDERRGWHGEIGEKFTAQSQWESWFSTYERFLTHYAEIAERTQVDLLCIGTELQGMTGRSATWRRLITETRKRFRGPLTYASCGDGEHAAITWWDALDYVGIDAYYPLSESLTVSVKSLKDAWRSRGYLNDLKGLAARVAKPLLFTEVGYRSVRGGLRAPWDWQSQGSVDLSAQAMAYEATLDALWGQPWLAGMYWWYWDVDPKVGGSGDRGYSPFRKPAEQVLKRYYARRYTAH